MPKLTNEEIEQLYNQYAHYAEVTVHKKFKNPRNYAGVFGLEYDDLIQFARIGVYNAIKSWKEDGNSSLKSWIIKNVMWTINRSIDQYKLNQSYYRYRFYKGKKREYNPDIVLLSMSHKPYENEGDQSDYYDLVPCDSIFSFNTDYVEDVVIDDLSANRILDKLKPKDRELVLLKMEKGLSYAEIAQLQGVCKQAIGNKFKRIQKQISEYMENVV